MARERFTLVVVQARALAGFVDHHLWVTRYHASELYASGDYPRQGGIPGGLPAWSSNDESIEHEDVVVWYTLGVTHVPRPEDYPVMPVEHAGVKLVPQVSSIAIRRWTCREKPRARVRSKCPETPRDARASA